MTGLAALYRDRDALPLRTRSSPSLPPGLGSHAAFGLAVLLVPCRRQAGVGPGEDLAAVGHCAVGIQVDAVFNQDAGPDA